MNGRMPNQAFEQTRDSVLRYGEPVGCELLNFVVRALMRRHHAALLMLALCGCESRAPQPPVINRIGDLGTHVGEVVVIRGEVSDTKIPEILGVAVRSDDPDLRGRRAEAIGVLQRYEVSPEEITKADYANQGPGVFYRLKDIGSDREAAVQAIQP